LEIALDNVDLKIYPAVVYAIDGSIVPVRLLGVPGSYPSPHEVARHEALMPEADSIGKCVLADSLSDIITPPAGDVGEVVPSVPVLPDDLFSRSPAAGAPILQKYLDSLPTEDRYAAFEPLVREHWKWLCKAAPYLKFPEPKPILEGQRINIGLRIFSLTGGGAQRSISLLANHFASDPHYNVILFIDDNQAGRLDYPISSNVRVEFINSGIANWAEIIKKLPQDLIILSEHWDRKNYINILLLKLLGVRVLAQERNSMFNHHPFKNYKEKQACVSPLYTCCDAVSCLSRCDLYGWRKNGVSNSIFLPNLPTFDPRSTTPAPLESNNILWVGRWDPWQKRPQMAIEVFAKVLQKVPNARLIMAGPIDNRRCYRRCLRRIQELGIGHAVNIVGFQKDMVPIYAQGALLLSTSHEEGWGMMIAEAKTFGLPVVSTAMPYLETLKKGCIQTPRNDVDATADAIVDLLQNPEKRKQLGADGRQDMLENFSNEITFAKYDALMDAIWAGPDAVAKLCAAEPLMDAAVAEKIVAEEAKFFK
jgi:glycosyltransferase involved in cell wall biosynthesis